MTTVDATAPAIALEEVEAPPWAIRAEQPLDLDLIHDLHRAAFRRSEEAELVDAIRSGPDFIPELSLVAATDDGSVLGHVLVSRVTFQPDVDGEARQDALALAPLAVLPPHWGRGIGSALVRAVLPAADEREEAFIAVLGSPQFYGRFGFTAAPDFGIRSPYDDAGDAFQVRPRGGSGSLPPGTISYPPKFGSV